jgi:hypothetical protein
MELEAKIPFSAPTQWLSVQALDWRAAQNPVRSQLRIRYKVSGIEPWVELQEVRRPLTTEPLTEADLHHAVFEMPGSLQEYFAQKDFCKEMDKKVLMDSKETVVHQYSESPPPGELRILV